MQRKLIIRTTTVPISLKLLLKGQLQFLNKSFDVIGISSPEKELYEVCQQEGIRIYPVKMERKIAPFRDIISIFQMVFLFLKLKPIIVHSITPKAGLVSMIAAMITGVPIRIHTFTGLIFPTSSGIKKIILKNIDRLICFCATEIIPEGNGVKNDLIKNNITKKDLDVLGNGNVNGIDLNYFSQDDQLIQESQNLKNKLSISEDDFIFTFIGRLVEDKGIIELLDAFQNLTDYKTKIHLIIAGTFEDNFKDFNLKIKKKFERNQNIHWIGFVEDIRPVLIATKVLVLPSYREGFPNVVLQAGAMDVPCIVSNINGCNEIIIEEINGLIVPAKDTALLERSMKRILNDNVLYLKLKTNSREQITSRFDQKYLWECIKEKYDNLLAKI